MVLAQMSVGKARVLGLLVAAGGQVLPAQFRDSPVRDRDPGRCWERRERGSCACCVLSFHNSCVGWGTLYDFSTGQC